VTVSTKLVLESRHLDERFRMQHLDTSDHRSGRNVGVWDTRNVIGALGAVTRLLFTLRPPRGLLYLPLSQSTPGFVRDSLFVLSARMLGWKVAAHLRGSDFRSYYETSPRALKRWIRLTLRQVNSVAVMGESLRWVFAGLVPDERIFVVPNGTPDPNPLPNGRDHNHVLFLSNLRRRKGVVEAVDAALLVLEQIPSVRFTFAGSWESDHLERELRDRVRAFNGGVTFQPPVVGREKDRLLASAAILLFPPVEPEGHPRVVLEALAAGVPVVTTDRGAISETVTDGRDGFVLPDPEPHLLADRVVRLLEDSALYDDFSRAARETYEARLTQSRADNVLSDWLAELV
jgi:glycosyltransferase involved in cell wall biosynthesis